MKRSTAIIAAALVMMSAALPVFAEEDDSSAVSVAEQSAAEESSQAAADESSAEGSEEASSEESSGGASQEGSEESGSEESAGDGSQEGSEETSGTVSTAQDSKPDGSDVSGSEVSELSLPENVKLIDYRVEEAAMKISIPSDMYVITRATDKDDPVLSVNRTTKEEITKTFEENDIYLRANPRDFSFVVNITVSETDDTQAIGDITELSEEKLKSITDKLLKSDIYTDCKQNTYGGTLFLTFKIEYENSGTKIEGLQEYTINDGKCIKITYQTAGDGDNARNQEIFGSMMDSLRFDGIMTEPVTEVKREESKPLTLSDVDIRYIYIIIASIIGIIALAVMVIAGIRYSKTKKLAARRKAWEEEEKRRKEASVRFVDHDEEQKEIFSDTQKKKESENLRRVREEKEKKSAAMPSADDYEAEPTIDSYDYGGYAEISADGVTGEAYGYDESEDFTSEDEVQDIETDIHGDPLSFDGDEGDIFGAAAGAAVIGAIADQDNGQIDLEATNIVEMPVDYGSGEELQKAADEARMAYPDDGYREIDAQPDDGEVVFADHGEKRRTEIEQIILSEGTEGLTVAELPSAVDAPETDELSEYDKHFGTNGGDSGVSEYEKRFGSTATDAADTDAASVGGAAPAADNSLFAQMLNRIKETNSEVSRDIGRMEKTENGILSAAENTEQNENEIAGDNDGGENGEEGMNRVKKNIELEISRSEDGSLVIGAMNESNGEPVDIEIRDASNFKEERDREMAELGFEVASENEIYNARVEENEENPFVVKAKAETPSKHKNGGKAGSAPDRQRKASEEKTAAKNNAGETKNAVNAASGEVKKMNTNDQTAKQAKEIVPAGTAFTGESGIDFEVAPVQKRQVTPMQSVFTSIPRLESVNAEEYNRQFEEMKKSMPRNHVYAQRFSASDVPQPFIETPKPITNTAEIPEVPMAPEAPMTAEAPMAPEAPMTADAQPDNGYFDFYTGYEENGDPFANNNGGEEVLIKEHKKKNSESVGARFKRSLGKLFSNEIPEDEEQ